MSQQTVESSNPLPCDCRALPVSMSAFDRSQFLARCLGNLAFAERILAKFQKMFADDLAGIRSALAAADADSVARVAHRLKGSAANVSAQRLRESLAELEQIGRTGQLDMASACLQRLEDEWHAFRRQASMPESPT